MDRLKQDFTNDYLYETLMTSKIHITNLFIYQLFNIYYEDYHMSPDFSWQNLIGYKELVNFLLFQIHNENNIKGMENNNLLKAINATINNSFYINLIFPLLVTKINLEEAIEVNILFELFALTCEKFTLRKDFFKLNLEQNSFSKMVIYILNSSDMQN